MPTLDFKGKQFVYAHHLTVPFRQLTVDAKKSLPAKGAKPNLDDNLIIHGDNLHALKALLPKYAGKIKCIYIDPPYNTGNEGWCYNDNVNAPLIKEWLKDSANPVDKEDLERHDKWLCMMWPRLQLLRELLADDGVIFVSIDDNEITNLNLIMDEIFNAKHVATVPVINNLKGRNDKANVAQCHEYLLIYDKGAFLSKGLPLSTKQIKEFKYQDGNRRYALRDVRKRGGADTRELRSNLYFPIYYNQEKKSFSLKRMKDSDIEIYPLKSDGIEGCWKWSPKKVEENLAILEASYVKKSDKWNVSYRVYLDSNDTENLTDDDDEEVSEEWDDEGEIPFDRTTKTKSFWWGPEISTDVAGKWLKKILGNGLENFDHPKPVHFIKRILHMATDKDSVVLDSFAGSGTTAEALLALNKEDGGNRKFILVECEKYANDITAERVRRVIKGVDGTKDAALKDGFGGSFTFCALGNEINIENLLQGENLPSFDELARYAFYTATGQVLNTVKQGADYFVGETDNYRVHLIYKPDLAFLRSGESALNMPLAESVAQARGKKTALVFATHKFMGQKELTGMGITFCQLPYQLHRIMGD
ncbi:site-specific DNA-methyltransferase [bacterium]|nr:site-specific DNA-methyltransferase [bacterium]